MSQGCVGIFWFVPGPDGTDVLVTDMTPLDRAETYGGCLTHAEGHAEFWESMAKTGPVGLAKRGLPPAMVWSEYDDHPRGRVVFRRSDGFVIFADRRLHAPAFIGPVARCFGLADRAYRIAADPHYRTKALP